jgi:hypothetical protein
MTTKVASEQTKSVEVLSSQPPTDFEAWAKQVRLQMIASLNKRGLR